MTDKPSKPFKYAELQNDNVELRLWVYPEPNELDIEIYVDGEFSQTITLDLSLRNEIQKGSIMLTMDMDMFEDLIDLDDKVCVYCDTRVDDVYCSDCMEYKGIMTIAEWQNYTGEIWEDQ